MHKPQSARALTRAPGRDCKVEIHASKNKNLRLLLLYVIMFNNENNELHVLQPLLPDKTISCYKLRPRKHDRQLLIRKSAHRNDSLFVVRMLYKFRFILTFLFFYETFRPNCMSLFTCKKVSK